MKLSIQGTVLEKDGSNNEAYEEARKGGFASNGHHSYPAIIAKPSSVKDVQECIRYGNAQGLKVTVRSGGHNWFGTFLRDGVLMLDMSEFNQMELDVAKEEATVGPCTAGITLVEASEKHGLHFPVGHAHGVPLGGYLLGGGLGWFLDFYGLACNHVVGAQVVTPQGDVITIREGDADTKDWMYLLRGSASAFPGVVVSFTLKLSKVPAIVRAGMAFFPKTAYDTLAPYLHQEKANGNIPSNIEMAAIVGDRPPPLAEAIPDEQIMMLMMNVVADSEEDYEATMAFLRSKTFEANPPFLPTKLEDTKMSSQLIAWKDTWKRGNHWVSRHFFVNPSDTIPYADLRQVYEKHMPIISAAAKTSACALMTGFMTSMESKDGCVRIPGSIIMNDSHCSDEDAANTDALDKIHAYCVDLTKAMEPFTVQHNPLEHPVDETTYQKCWKDADKIWRVRSKLDPQGVFFDPSKAKLPGAWNQKKE